MVKTSPRSEHVQSSKKVTCRYCEVPYPRCDMKKIPNTPEQLSKWIQILGPKFAENTKRFSNNFICLSHIEKEEKYRLPEDVNNIPPINSKPKKYGKKRCRYCGISRPKSDMTIVPANPEQLSKWIEILGTNFAENIKQFKWNFICLDHFENNKRKNSLPKRIENIDMVVTDDVDDEEVENREQDRKRIGEKEVEDKEDIGNNEEIITKQFQKIENQDKEMVPQESQVSISSMMGMETEKESKPLVVKLEMEEREVDYINTQASKFDVMEPNEIGGETNNDSNIIEANVDDDNIQCRACGCYFNRSSMTEVPSDPEQINKWIGVLGSLFFANMITNSPPHFICVNDLRKMVDKFCQEQS